MKQHSFLLSVMLVVLSSMICFLTNPVLVLADDYEPADEPTNSTNDFILDADNSGGDITIQFGETLNESLSWNDTQSYFELSNVLVINGDMNVNGTVFRLDFDNSGVGADVSIVAEQGSDSNGILGYSAASNRWQALNDGGTFFPLVFGGFFSGYDATGNVSVTTTETILNLDTTRFIDNPPFSLASSVLTLNHDGVYEVTGYISVDSLNTTGAQRAHIQLRVELDPAGGGVVFADVPGAFCGDYMREQGNGISAASCSVSLIDNFTSGDSIRLTHQMSGTTTGQTLPGGSGLTVKLLRPE